MRRKRSTSSGLVTAILVASTATARAQASPDPERRFRVSVSGAFANLFIFEDRSYGKTFNAGVGAAVRLTSRLWADGEVNWLFGLEPEPAPCGLLNVECFGEGRFGYDAASAGSIGLTYRFGSGDVRATASGGYGFVRAHGFSTTTFSGGRQVEREARAYGWGPSFGVGLHIMVGSRWSIEPTMRLYGAHGPNITIFRAAVALGRTF